MHPQPSHPLHHSLTATHPRPPTHAHTHTNTHQPHPHPLVAPRHAFASTNRPPHTPTTPPTHRTPHTLSLAPSSPWPRPRASPPPPRPPSPPWPPPPPRRQTPPAPRGSPGAGCMCVCVALWAGRPQLGARRAGLRGARLAAEPASRATNPWAATSGRPLSLPAWALPAGPGACYSRRVQALLRPTPRQSQSLAGPTPGVFSPSPQSSRSTARWGRR